MEKLAFCFHGRDSAGFSGGIARSSLCPPARSARRNAAAKGTVRLAILSLAILSLMAVSVPANAAPASPATGIDEFIGCVNGILTKAKEAKTPVDVSDTVACFKELKDCSVTATKSTASAQPACTLFAGAAGTTPVMFPRLIFFCPNEKIPKAKTLIPEYTLCPAKNFPRKKILSGHGGANRVEIGEVNFGDPLKDTGRLIMAHFDLNPGIPGQIDLDNLAKAKNRGIEGVGTQSCNECHDATNPPTLPNPPDEKNPLSNLLLSGLTSPPVFTTDVLFTTQMDKKPQATKINNLEIICDKISNPENQNGLLKIDNGMDGKPLINKESLEVATKLCVAINKFFPPPKPKP